MFAKCLDQAEQNRRPQGDVRLPCSYFLLRSSLIRFLYLCLFIFFFRLRTTLSASMGDLVAFRAICLSGCANEPNDVPRTALMSTFGTSTGCTEHRIQSIHTRFATACYIMRQCSNGHAHRAASLWRERQSTHPELHAQFALCSNMLYCVAANAAVNSLRWEMRQITRIA